jgi:NitT/TauT family transport system substrate-binding protein
MHSSVPSPVGRPTHRSRWRRACAALALAGCAALLAACGPRHEAPLTVGTNTWTGYEPLYLARDLGLHNGLPLRLVELGSTTQSMDALRTGRLAMAGLTLDEVLTLVQEGVPLKVVWVVDISKGADALVARAGISGMADLRGRKVGVEQTAVGAYMLNAALGKAGLRSGDITVVPLPLDEHLAAWREGHVDALVTFDPVLQGLRGRGAQVLFDSSDIPGEIVDVLVARQEALDCCTPRIAQLLDAHQRALGHLHTARADALQRMAPRLGLTAAEMDAALNGIDLPDAATNRALLSGPEARLATSAQRMAHTMFDQGLLQRPVSVASLIDDRFVRGSKP